MDEDSYISTHEHLHDAGVHVAFFDLSVLPTIENLFSWNIQRVNQNQWKINAPQNEFFIQRLDQFISPRSPPNNLSIIQVLENTWDTKI